MTIEVTRRQLMASMGGMVLASFALPSALRKAVERAPASLLSSSSSKVPPISDIKHVVVLMQENRSFDHYFGAMPGVRGFSDPTAISGVFKQSDPDNPAGYLYPFHADTTSTSAQKLPSTSHDWGPQHGSYNGGLMDGFVTSRITDVDGDDYDGTAGQYSMAYFTRNDIPFHWALADAFTICDGYHCSVLGPTWPNRLYLMTGQIDPTGASGGPIYGDFVPTEGLSWQTYPELLTKAGVSWKVYQEVDNYGFNVLEYFNQYQNASVSSPLYQNAMKFYQPGQFEYDAINDRLPTVSYILPTSYQSEHPDFMPAAGADYVASKVNAIAANPDVWAKTVFILIYDENDGYFDHVVPPTPPLPVNGVYAPGTENEFITASASTEKSAPGPIGLGFRVPCVIVSPWTVGGYVCHDVFDHTSVTRLLELVTGVTNPNITPWRRQTVGDFTSALGTVPNGRFPRLPDTKAQLELAEKEVATFQLPAFPGATQTPPVQPPGLKPVRGGLVIGATGGSVTT